MEAPLCMFCNTRSHWTRQPCPAFKNPRSQSGAGSAAEEAKQQCIALKTTIETVTINTPISVTPAVTKKRGRPPTDTPLSNAERQRRWRQNQKLKAASP
jgi:hypothetical protein